MELRKYATALDATTAGSTLIRKSLRVAGEATFAVAADWTPAAGDVKVSIDGGAEANITALPVYANGAWEFDLTALELTGKMIRIRVSDVAVDDDETTIETFGSASAMWPDTYSTQLLPAALVGGKMDSIASIATDGISAGSLSPTATAEIQAGLATSAEVGALPTAAENAAALLPTALPASPAADTVGEALVAALAQGFGRWVVAGDTLTLYASNGTTPLKVFTLAPTGGAFVSRTPS